MIGTTDLVAALAEVRERFSAERVEATFILDGARLTVALEGSDLIATRGDGDDNAWSMTFPAPTIADLKASAQAAKRRHG